MASTPSAPMIFIAEDNDVLLQGLSRALRAHGYAVHGTSTGEELLEALGQAERPPALILVDLMMPGKDGLEVAKSVRAAERLRDVAILILTAVTPAELAGVDLEGLGVETLFKPFRLQELLDLVARLIDRDGKGG